MRDFVRKMFIFLPIVFGSMAYLEKLNNVFPVTVIFGICIIIGICFGYAIESLIESKQENKYTGCTLTLQNDKFECSCGSEANMYVAETTDNYTKIIIQCQNTNCLNSVNAESISLAKKAWHSMQV